MVTIAQRPKKRSLLTLCRKVIPREDNGRFKGPEAEVCLTSSRSKKKENIARTCQRRKE